MSFPRSMVFTSFWEAGLVDHPLDPGGRTNLGITQKLLDSARLLYPWKGLPTVVDLLTRGQSEFIYEEMFYKETSCHLLPEGIDLAVFDAAVNCGVSRARLWLQKAVKAKPDGHIGPATIAAVKAAPASELLMEFNAYRAYHYMLQDSIDDTFGLGWARRLMHCHESARGLRP